MKGDKVSKKSKKPRQKREYVKSKSPILDYLSKHSKAITLLIAIITPIVTILVSIMFYSYYHGYYKYFKISEVWMDISSDRFKYYPIFMIFISLLVMSLNIVPYLFIRCSDPQKKFGGVFWSIVIGEIFLAILFVLNVLAIKAINFIALGQMISMWILMYGIGVQQGISYLLSKKPKTSSQNQNEENNENNLVIGITIIVFCLVLEVFLCYYTGKTIASNEKEFKIINNSMIVLHETQDKFIVAEAEIDEKNNILNIQPKQTIIENTDVTYEIKTFAKVNPPKS